MGSDSHIPQSPVYQGHTHPLLTSPTTGPVSKARPFQSVWAETCETALILPLGPLAETEEKGRE